MRFAFFGGRRDAYRLGVRAVPHGGPHAWYAREIDGCKAKDGYRFAFARRALQRLQRQFLALELCFAHTAPPV